MRITEVSVRIADERDQNPMVAAYCSFFIDDFFNVTHVRLVRRKDGSLFVGMPNVRKSGPAQQRDSPTYEGADGQPYHYEDVLHPLSPEGRRYLTRVLTGAYRQVVADGLTRGIVPIPDRQAKAG